MALKRILLPERQVSKFIREVKKRECIWNSEDDKYNDRHATTLAWNEIVKIMDTPEDLLRAKWKNLRDLFKREVKKVRRKVTGEDEDGYQGRWRYFSQMLFMRKHRQCNREFLKRLDFDEPEEDRSHEEDATNGEEQDEIDDNPLSDCVKIEPVQSSDTEKHSEECVEIAVEPVPNKRRKIDEEDEEDYDMMFLKSLKPFFKQLDPMRKLIVRSKIQDILINEIATAQQQPADKC